MADSDVTFATLEFEQSERFQTLRRELAVSSFGATTEHYHRTSEELYLLSAGEGLLLLDGEERVIREGDCALIPPGARHKLVNVGDVPLRVICACSPAYTDEDTCLTE